MDGEEGGEAGTPAGCAGDGGGGGGGVGMEAADKPTAASAEKPKEEAKKSAVPREDDFEWGKCLGQGAFGEVLFGRVKDGFDTWSGREFAVKKIEKHFIMQAKNKEVVFRERQILDMLRHPNIIRLFYTFQSKSHLHFVMEYCKNGELYDYLRKNKSFNVEVSRFYAAQIVLALEYLHSKGVLHRDLKPENMLLDERMHLRIIDFGTSKNIGTDREARAKSFEGTAEYMSPELLGQSSQALSGDLWALGVILYQFLTGRYPFRSSQGVHYQTFQLIQNRDLTFPENFPPIAKDLVDKLLVVDPDNRLGASSFADLKAHPFFEGIDWGNLEDMEAPPMAPLDPPCKFPDAAPSTPTSARTAATDDDSSTASVPATPDTDRPPTALASTGGFITSDERRAIKAAIKDSTRLVSAGTWTPFLQPGENILEVGVVYKKRRMFNVKKRLLLLTDLPRLIYIDLEKVQQKGEIPVDDILKVEQKDSTNFHIIVPKRTYILEDRTKNIARWVTGINNMKNRK